jgi:hypothetical protein
MFGVADNNDSIMLIGSQNNFKALQVTNQEKQEDNFA